MARFDIYVNLDKAGSHPRYLDVQSNFVRSAPPGRLSASEQAMAESCIEFMLRGY